MRVLMYWFDKKNIEETKNLLEAEGHEVISVRDIKILEEQIWHYTPDVLLCHCHVITTPKRGFEKIQWLTKEVRNTLPDCVIIVTYNPKIDVRWVSIPLFGGRQDHSYLFSLLGIGEGLTPYEKDFMFPENFLNTEKLYSLNTLVSMVKSKELL